MLWCDVKGSYLWFASIRYVDNLFTVHVTNVLVFDASKIMSARPSKQMDLIGANPKPFNNTIFHEMAGWTIASEYKLIKLHCEMIYDDDWLYAVCTTSVCFIVRVERRYTINQSQVVRAQSNHLFHVLTSLPVNRFVLLYFFFFWRRPNNRLNGCFAHLFGFSHYHVNVAAASTRHISCWGIRKIRVLFMSWCVRDCSGYGLIRWICWLLLDGIVICHRMPTAG